MTRNVLVVGGGYAGLTTARRLLRRLPDDVRLTLINPHSYMTYQPLLPEAAAGAVQPGHVVVPLRRALPGARVLTASLTSLDPVRRTAVVRTTDDGELLLEYDEIVFAVGSVTRTLPVPGLVEHAIGFRTVEEAVHLHNRVLSRLDAAASATDAESRERALTFVFVGGGYAGVEALAEVEDMVRRACADHHGHLRPTTNVRCRPLRSLFPTGGAGSHSAPFPSLGWNHSRRSLSPGPPESTGELGGAWPESRIPALLLDPWVTFGPLGSPACRLPARQRSRLRSEFEHEPQLAVQSGAVRPASP